MREGQWRCGSRWRWFCSGLRRRRRPRRSAIALYSITAPGAYEVTQDLTCAGAAITITASDVDLNLGGHTLSGNDQGDGVSVQGQANVSIHDGTVQGFVNGVVFQQTLNSQLSHVTVRQSSNLGIIGGVPSASP